MLNVTTLTERIKADILAQVASGRVPADVPDFAALHNHVDANTLGDADMLFGEICTDSDTDAEYQVKLDAFTAIHVPAIEAVDAWIRAGGITYGRRLQKLAKRLRYRRYIAKATGNHEAAHQAYVVKVKYDYYLGQHQSRLLRRSNHEST